MNWSNLPFYITEKIIKYAAECPNKCGRVYCCCQASRHDESSSNWMMRVHTYGQVCRGWKEVIFHSKIMFDGEKSEFDLICFDEQTDQTKQKLQQMITDGYLELTSQMTLIAIEKDYEGKTLQLIREFAGESSIKTMDVIWDTDQRNDDNFSILINILKESKMIENFEFSKHIYSQRDFMAFWERLIAVLQIEKIKIIELNISWYDVDAAYFDLLDAYPDRLFQHIHKIQVHLCVSFFIERDFIYAQSDELKMSDFVKKFRGA